MSDGCVQAYGVVQVYRRLYKRLGVRRVVGLGGAIFVPPRPKGQTVILHHPRMFSLDSTSGRVGVCVAEPFAVLVGNSDQRFSSGIVIRPDSHGGRPVNQSRIRGVG